MRGGHAEASGAAEAVHYRPPHGAVRAAGDRKAHAGQQRVLVDRLRLRGMLLAAARAKWKHRVLGRYVHLSTLLFSIV